MKFLIITTMLLLFSCAHHNQMSHQELKKYASYQMNCPVEQLKVEELGDNQFKLLGCKKSEKFTKMCSLGPCYLLLNE